MVDFVWLKRLPWCQYWYCNLSWFCYFLLSISTRYHIFLVLTLSSNFIGLLCTLTPKLFFRIVCNSSYFYSTPFLFMILTWIYALLSLFLILHPDIILLWIVFLTSKLHWCLHISLILLDYPSDNSSLSYMNTRYPLDQYHQGKTRCCIMHLHTVCSTCKGQVTQ
jgi:hypothetical protein